MGDGPKPFSAWGTRDWVALVICLLLGNSVTGAVGEALPPSLDFWPALALKIAAGFVTAIVALTVWGRLIRSRM